jgi:hypothetical protein
MIFFYLRRPVSEWCDNKTISASQILVLVGKRDISDDDKSLVGFFFEVEATLLQPFKVIDVSHV